MNGNKKAIYLTHPDCLQHLTGDGHPESPARLNAILPVLDKYLEKMEADELTPALLELVHIPSHVKHVLSSVPEKGLVWLDADTSMSPVSRSAALRAAGAATQSIDLLLDGKAHFVFNAVRPPGHHATKKHSGGFCLFNNAALAAVYSIRNKKVPKVAIIDFDVHHGNGTQHIVWKEKDILFISSHQSPLYPYTGGINETGEHHTIMNLPMRSGTTGKEMRKVYSEKVFPRVSDFNPDLIIVSAGFDAHKDDPLASLQWETEDFGWLGEEIKKLADECCQGRVMATLEGGYNLQALADSTEAFIKPFTE